MFCFWNILISNLKCKKGGGILLEINNKETHTYIKHLIELLIEYVFSDSDSNMEMAHMYRYNYISIFYLKMKCDILANLKKTNQS